MKYVALALFAAVLPLGAAGKGSYEVWALDQSNSAGKTYGGTLYIWDGHDLENKHRAASAPMQKIDLAGAVSELCFAKTGANPVRPHMLFFNSAQTHAIISFVASGHVLIMHAASRQAVACIRMSPGVGGAIQAHAAVPSPDEKYIIVANQNGKLLERINTDYPTNTFVHDAAATLNLATCITPNGQACETAGVRPDNAPICPMIESSSQFTFITLRGGGLFVVDGGATPMSIMGEYDNTTVHPNGCGGTEANQRMFIDSGGGTPANLHEADLYSFPLAGYSPLNPVNTPLPRVVFSDDVMDADAHGTTATKHGKYVWVGDRGRNFVFVVDTATETLVNRIFLAGEFSDDPAPDLFATTPNGSHVVMSLRGPNPLTGDPHVSTGSTPGVGVIKVLAGGREGKVESVAGVSNMDGGVERADVHGLAIRVTR